MANRIKHLEDCSTGREFGQWARDHGARTDKNGSYECVTDEKGNRAYVPDSDRALPKPSRLLIVQAFVKLGLAATIVFAVLSWIGVL
jgi:hypothetical protein